VVKREEGRGKREEGRGKREEGRGKREEGLTIDRRNCRDDLTLANLPSVENRMTAGFGNSLLRSLKSK
jgi:hypothetical protein